tara:strand:- start:68 stop:361 length:294 start_codon:yes stop_codon:yes gene_type:complete
MAIIKLTAEVINPPRIVAYESCDDNFSCIMAKPHEPTTKSNAPTTSITGLHVIPIATSGIPTTINVTTTEDVTREISENSARLEINPVNNISAYPAK